MYFHKCSYTFPLHFPSIRLLCWVQNCISAHNSTNPLILSVINKMRWTYPLMFKPPPTPHFQSHFSTYVQQSMTTCIRDFKLSPCPVCCMFSTCLWRWNRQSVPKRRHIKFRRWGITQKKTCNIQNMAKFWNQEQNIRLLLPQQSRQLPLSEWWQTRKVYWQLHRTAVTTATDTQQTCNLHTHCFLPSLEQNNLCMYNST